MDFVALVLGVGFFAICWSLTVWCDRVLREGGSPR